MLKKLILLGAVVAIIPLEGENQADLYLAAKSTVADITGFCGRNPSVCEKGNAAIDRLATKAEFGAKMVVNIAKEQAGDSNDQVAQLLKKTQLPANAPSTHASTSTPLPAQSNERFPTYQDKQYNDHYGRDSNTLSASDLTPGWRGGSSQ